MIKSINYAILSAMSIRKWLVIFLVFSLTIPLSIAAFNIYTDMDMIFTYPNSVHRKYIKQAVTALNRGDFLQVNHYHVPQASFLRGLHLATNTPDILLFGTSRLMLLNSSHIPKDKLKFINSSINGGAISGIIGAWQQYRENIPNHKASYAFVEVYPLMYLEEVITQRKLLIQLTTTNLDKTSQSHVFTRIQENKRLIIENIFSASYFFKNIRRSIKRSFVIVESIDDKHTFITPDGSYIQEPISDDVTDKIINLGLAINRSKLIDHISAWSLIKALTRDILAHDITPILILPSFHPVTYDLATDGNDLLQTIEADVLAFAQEHNIMVVGSFNPHPYNLDASYFRDGGHSTAEMWEVLFADFTFPEPLKIDDQW